MANANSVYGYTYNGHTGTYTNDKTKLVQTTKPQPAAIPKITAPATGVGSAGLNSVLRAANAAGNAVQNGSSGMSNPGAPGSYTDPVYGGNMMTGDKNYANEYNLLNYQLQEEYLPGQYQRQIGHNNQVADDYLVDLATKRSSEEQDYTNLLAQLAQQQSWGQQDLNYDMSGRNLLHSSIRTDKMDRLNKPYDWKRGELGTNKDRALATIANAISRTTRDRDYDISGLQSELQQKLSELSQQKMLLNW